MLRSVLTLATCALSAHAAATTDLVRATMQKPRPTSGLLSQTQDGVFTSINSYMKMSGHRVAPCEAFSTSELADVGEKILGLRDMTLHNLYKRNGDMRGHIDLGGDRDGMCAHVLMLWAHQIPEGRRGEVNVTLPLMPVNGPRVHGEDDRYDSQVSCTSCHYAKYSTGDDNEVVVKPYRANDTSPPRWGGNNATRQYSVTVNMTDISDSPDHPRWMFKYYYNDELKSSRYEHLAGQDDEVCRGATPTLQPCTVIFATNGFTYIQSNTTCCIRNYGTFGAVRSDWLQDGGASYVGRSTVNGYEVDEWFKQGASDNHYYATSNGYRTPVRYMEHKNGKLKQWDFNVATWKPSPQPRSLFDPPANCDKKCA